ncbi:MAG: hypothetical protein ACYTEQ_10160 [Planctomycetota bacterium]|jgi:hypothetical protein
MEAYLKQTDFTEGGEEYVISCEVLVSPAEGDGTTGDRGAGNLKEVVCIIEIERKHATEPAGLCLN